MNIGTVRVSYNRAIPTGLQRITTGMVGATVDFIFDDTWVGCHKTYVWKAGDVIKDDTTASGIVPAEVLTEPGRVLFVGVYGVSGSVATPTLWACLGPVLAGATPSGDESTDPLLPVWAQLQEEIERLKAGGGAGGSYVPDASEASGDGFALVTKNGKWVISDAPMCTKSDIYGVSSGAAAAHERIDELETTANTAKSSAEAAQLQAMQAKTVADGAAELANDFNADIVECLNRINSLEYTAGNINTALDAIIAIQESLIGGDA